MGRQLLGLCATNARTCMPGARAPQLERGHRNERPAYRSKEWPPTSLWPEKRPCAVARTQHSQK